MSSALPITNAFVAAEPALAPSGPSIIGKWDAATISVERATATRLAEIDAAWRDLAGRSDEPNVFMDPAILRLAGDRCVTLLAWNGEGKLLGIWAFAVAHQWHPALPVKVLRSPSFPHAYLATPVVDRTVAHAVLVAMLDFIADDPALPKLISLQPIRSDGPAMQALEVALADRGSSLCTLSESRRPVLASALDAKSYFAQALSSSSRKKLRQHRRRLEEQGGLESRAVTEPAAVCRAFEEFLQLEAAGWKGRRGTALLCDEADANFTRAMIASLASRGDAWIHALYQRDKAVAAQVVLRAGAVAFTWKTAYDETLGDFSPGMLLLEDYTAAFLADKSIARVDSCSFDDTGFMSAWSEREQIADALLDARRGGSFAFSIVIGLQRGFLALRARAKTLYLLGRRKWTGH
jgi:CelD/BcsL family acetyltransferase involved in cellulose biosynthesis